MNSGVQIFPLSGLPEIKSGDDLARLIADAARAQAFAAADGDIFVIAQKIVSKAEGQIVRLDTIAPSTQAISWAKDWDKDARVIELVLRESKRIVRMERGIIIVETRHGFVCANAGIDLSNAGKGTAILLPADPDASARGLHSQLGAIFGADIGVIISDTFGRPWREGLVNVALGVAGVAPLIDYRGERDANGKVLQATIIAFADEIASATELVMGKSDRVPVAIVRGVRAKTRAGTGRDLIRPAEKDLFR
ncbi:MAG TPA: coenzyme F420-0:L-glutamate ligase [Micropepsaceae bacterium]|nr:coenzyme F420-0:L-glutamate ligase [Micropepsaceae bacterium]